MDIEITHNSCTAVKVHGEIDIGNVDEFSAMLEKAAKDAQNGCLVVDLSSATYIDGAGIKEILRIYHRLISLGGAIAVVPSKMAQRILEILRAHELPGFKICDDFQMAIKALLSYTGNLQ
ncbi:MAG: STAS domain-containing protein [Armatimonadetes bacterium]|nr:STAS domain-containing protein [Armatimonadota bacterium]